MFNQLKLRYRMLFGYGVFVLFFVALAVMVYLNTKTFFNLSEQVTISVNTVQGASDIALGISRMVSDVQGYVITNKIDHLKSYEKRLKLFREAASIYREEAIQNPEQRKRLTQLVSLGNQFDDLAKKEISLVQKDKIKEASALVASGEAERLIDTINDLVAGFRVREKVTLATRQEEAGRALRFLTKVATFGILLSIILSIITALITSSGVARLINDAVTDISTTSTEIASTAEEHARTAMQQAASVNETTTTMEELDVSSSRAAEQAESAAAATRQALSLALGGIHPDKPSLGDASSVREKMKVISEQILYLSEQIGQIGNITNFVSDLANQTNMLALNAAVEAARAGEHGKGFSIVAAEIRKLADQSKKSAERISALVTDNQKATNSTVMVTEEGARAVEGLAVSITSAFESVQQISLNVRQQAAAIRQVVGAMDSINAGAKETAAGITQTRLGIQKLNEAAQRLKAMM